MLTLCLVDRYWPYLIDVKGQDSYWFWTIIPLGQSGSWILIQSGIHSVGRIEKDPHCQILSPRQNGRSALKFVYSIWIQTMNQFLCTPYRMDSLVLIQRRPLIQILTRNVSWFYGIPDPEVDPFSGKKFTTEADPMVKIHFLIQTKGHSVLRFMYFGSRHLIRSKFLNVKRIAWC